MNIAIVIPTFKRIKKLERCLESLKNQTYKNFSIHIYCDNNDIETYNYIRNNWINKKELCVYYTLNSKQEFVIGSWNKFFKEQNWQFSNYDAVLWCVDDVELYSNTLANALACMIKNFPDLDGVVGLGQVCPGEPHYSFKWYGQVLIGRKFIEKYKEVNYQLCCPEYSHFYQDEELWIFANSLNKFKNCEDAILKHYHPSFLSKEKDETHSIVRGRIKTEDTIIYNKRQAKQLCWGKSWEKIK